MRCVSGTNEITNYIRTNKVFMTGLCHRPTPKTFWVMDRLCFDKFIAACTQLHTIHYGSI